MERVNEMELAIKWEVGAMGGKVDFEQNTKYISREGVFHTSSSFDNMDAFWESVDANGRGSSPLLHAPRPTPLPNIGMPLPSDRDVVLRPPPPMPMPMPGGDDGYPRPLSPPPPMPMMPVSMPMDEPDGLPMADDDTSCCLYPSIACLAKLIPRWDPQSAKDQHRNRRKITNESEREQAWMEYIENHPDIGVITLAYMHQSHDSALLTFLVRFLMVSLILVQLIIPILVLKSEASQYYSDEEGLPLYCPSTADALTRTLSITIGIIYLGKLTFICLQKLLDSDNSPVLIESEHGGKIQLAIAADRFMHLAFEPAIYFLNLWLVYITPEPLDMVLNALAMEFILQLDDELKPVYLSVFEPDVKLYKEENNESGSRKIGPREYVAVVLLSVISLWSMIFLCAAIYAATLYLPICKPGS